MWRCRESLASSGADFFKKLWIENLGCVAYHDHQRSDPSFESWRRVDHLRRTYIHPRTKSTNSPISADSSNPTLVVWEGGGWHGKEGRRPILVGQHGWSCGGRVEGTIFGRIRANVDRPLKTEVMPGRVRLRLGIQKRPVPTHPRPPEKPLPVLPREKIPRRRERVPNKRRDPRRGFKFCPRFAFVAAGWERLSQAAPRHARGEWEGATHIQTGSPSREDRGDVLLGDEGSDDLADIRRREGGGS